MATIRRSRTTEITIEAEEVVTSYELPGSIRWCAECGKQVPMVRPDTAARTAGVGLQTVSRWIHSKTVHVYRTEPNHVLICLVSLGKRP